MRKDGSDHRHEWETRTLRRGDLAEMVHYCPRCGLRSRKGATQHPSHAAEPPANAPDAE